MRKLHLVGFTSDRKGLIYSARRGSKSGGFLVPIEDSLVARIEEATRGPNGDDASGPAPQPITAPMTGAPGRPRSQSALTPREMQARLRAGRTIAEVAAEAKADPEWVERFAIPILAEQAQMVELARSLTYVKPRRGESAEPLGASVAENLVDRGVQLLEDEFDAAWTAFQLHDVVWVVRVRYRSRGRLQEAAWEVNVATGQLTSRNRLASDLGFVEKGRRRRPLPRLDVETGAVEVPADGPITRRASSSRGKAATDGGGRSRTRGTARRPAGTRSTKAAARPAKRPASPSIARAPSSTKTTSAAKTRSAAKTKAAARTKAAATKARPAARNKAAAKTRSTAGAGGATKARSATKARAATTAKRAAARGRSGAPAKRPSTSVARPAKATKRAATRSGGARPRARKAAVADKRPGPAGPARASESPPGPAGLRGQNATAGLRGQNATAGPSGQNATAGLRGPNATAGLRGQNANGRDGDAQVAEGPAEERARVPINRLAANRVAASRAAAARLSDDRRAANPVPASEADVPPSYRPARPNRSEQPLRPGHTSSPAETPSRPTRPAPAPAARPAPARQPVASEPERAPRPRKPSVADLVFEDLLESDEPPERPWATDEVTTGERPVIAAERVGSGGSRSSGERPGREEQEFGTSSPWPLRAG